MEIGRKPRSDSDFVLQLAWRPTRVAGESEQAIGSRTVRQQLEHFARCARYDTRADLELALDSIEALLGAINQPDLFARNGPAHADAAGDRKRRARYVCLHDQFGKAHDLAPVQDPAKGSVISVRCQQDDRAIKMGIAEGGSGDQKAWGKLGHPAKVLDAARGVESETRCVRGRQGGTAPPRCEDSAKSADSDILSPRVWKPRERNGQDRSDKAAMRVTFYGVRGSVPAPGPQTARYGGNTSCVEVRLADGSTVALDAGTGLRELGNTLVQEGRESKVHLLLSHTHWDHVLGLPFFAPLWNRANHLLVYPLANDAQERFQRTIFDDIHFPVSVEDIPARVELTRPEGPIWRIGSATVRSIRLNHPGGAQGFRIDDDDGSSLAYLTDNELNAKEPIVSLEELARFAEGVDLVIHDAQYLPSDMPRKLGWGHSIVDDVLRLGILAGPKRLALFHHDPDRTDDALDQLGERSRIWVRQRASSVEILVAREGLSLDL